MTRVRISVGALLSVNFYKILICITLNYNKIYKERLNHKNKMKIMQIAPFGLPIRENIKYGGIERVIRDLDKQYFKRGHESFVVATENSDVSGTLCPTLKRSSWISERNRKEGWKYQKKVENHKEDFEKHCLMASNYIRELKPDVIHDHMGFIRSGAFQGMEDSSPILVTLHGPLDENNVKRFEDMRELTRNRNVKFNSISELQRRMFSKILSVDYTVLNAVDIEKYPYRSNGEGFVFSLGLISSSKGTDIAIKVSRELGRKIVVAGPIHQFVPEIRDFWEKEVKDKIDLIYGKTILPEDIGNFVKDFVSSDINSIYIGELNDLQKAEWFGRADVFYFPIRWQEPFGLVMIESNACGTPVVAYSGGSVPEVINHGENGYVINQGDFKGFLYYASKVEDLSREKCRKHVEDNFTIERQATEYLKIYEEIMSGKKNLPFFKNVNHVKE